MIKLLPGKTVASIMKDTLSKISQLEKLELQLEEQVTEHTNTIAKLANEVEAIGDERRLAKNVKEKLHAIMR